MRVVVDTGVFSATLTRRPRPELQRHVARLVGHQPILSPLTVAELRYGALRAGWGQPRLERLESAIANTTALPITDALTTRVAQLRVDCQRAGHPLAAPAHTADLWIAAAAVHTAFPLLTADRIFEAAPGLELLT